MAAARTMLLEYRILRSILAGVPATTRVAQEGSRCFSLTQPTLICSFPQRYFSGFSSRSSILRKEIPVRHMATATDMVVSESDIINRIKHDHEELEEYYSNYKKAHQNGQNEEAGKWFNQFVWEIFRHAVSEELVLYPLLSAQNQRGKELANQSRTDHQETKNILEELQTITDPELFDKKMEKMMHDLREHIKKEESEDLVFLQENVDQTGREAAGTAFHLGKNLVPTRPHASVPNKPAALEAALGLLITPIDKLRDVFTPFPKQS